MVSYGVNNHRYHKSQSSYRWDHQLNGDLLGRLFNLVLGGMMLHCIVIDRQSWRSPKMR